MKYRHAHHAGNFADTVKHLVLIELLEALQRKPAPLFYLETHAGRGRYFVAPGERGEFNEGFGQLHGSTVQAGALGRYIDTINRLAGTGSRREMYPGSPLIVSELLRAGDRAVLFELQPEEATSLQKLLGRRKGVTVHCGDGYDALRSHLPPAERRGLVLIDPAYEEQERDFARILEALREGLLRWATGVYAVWYPIKRIAPVRRFREDVVRLGARRVLAAELCVYPPDSRASLNGCGVLVINAPWQIDTALQSALPALHRALHGRPGTGASCQWLVPD